ncbi:hypothetical protein H0194_04955 [Corynebacterium incognita]|uniref:Uncharacterized protein n=1 Tax=Corynebacterium incognita TaxID=2754725 RepID=A0A7G7CRV9_9CORY|nr:hypothetical protein [Corynebacterium incognita]QNE90325.1 hypothetical protein H0194_04955 [Corynebacterium incognita]
MPGHAECVSDLAVGGAPGLLGQWDDDLAALGQLGEDAVALVEGVIAVAALSAKPR